MIAAAITLFCIALIFYAYIGYPILLWVLAKVFGQRRTQAFADDQWPSASLIIPVHNGASLVADKIANCQSLQYPGNLDIWFVLDGCTDGTADALQQAVKTSDDRWPVRVHESKERVGKEVALRQLIGDLETEVLVFSDADAQFQSDTVMQLVGPLSDPTVGVACGRETHVSGGPNSTGAAQGEGLFYKIENAIKLWQIPVCSMTYVQGGVFSCRREIFPMQLRPGCTQDGVIAFETVLQNYRVRFAPDAISVEPYKISVGQDYARRVRTVCRAFYSILCYGKMFLLPRTMGYAFHVLSHRMLRWFFIPLFFIIAITSTIAALMAHWVFWVIPAGQACFLVLAWLGKEMERRGRRSKLPYFAYYFISLHSAAFTAVLQTIGGRRVVTWKPTDTL